MQKPVTFTVQSDDGTTRTYMHTLHGAIVGLEIFERLMKAAAEPLGDFFAAIGDFDTILAPEAKTEDFNFGGMGRAGGVLASNVLKDPGLIQAILSETSVKGVGAVVDHFDGLYQGNFGELAQVLWRVVRDNFGKTFSRQSPLGQRLFRFLPSPVTAESSESSTEQPSSGKSGESSMKVTPRLPKSKEVGR